MIAASTVDLLAQVLETPFAVPPLYIDPARAPLRSNPDVQRLASEDRR